MFMPFDSRYHARDGEYIGMYIHPRPVQKPHPPVWLMSNTPFTYRMAAARGMQVVGMNSAPDNIATCWAAYRKSAAEARGLALEVGEGVAMCVVIYVAETMEAAERDIRPAINLYYEFVSGARPRGEWSRRAFLNEGRDLTSDDREADWFDFCVHTTSSGLGPQNTEREDRPLQGGVRALTHHAAAAVSRSIEREDTCEHDAFR